MSNETDGAETLAAEPVEQEEAIVENSDPAPEQQSEAEEDSEASASEETGEQSGEDAPAKPKEHWAHKRIDELTRQRREAERQADYWKAKAEQQSDTEDLDFEDGIAERVRRANQQEQLETAQASAQQLAAEAFGYREAEARERFADYDATVYSPNVPITPNMAEVIRDSDVGPDLAYHLGKNLKDASRIASLNPVRQAAELGRLEAKLTAPKPVPKTPAAPVKPVGGQKKPNAKDPAKMSMSEYIKAREEGKI